MTSPTDWPLPDFPPGVTYFKASLDAGDIGSTATGGWFTVQPETPMVWSATGKVFLDQTKTRALKAGHCEYWLPFTDQSGFIDGVGGSPIINWAYRFTYQSTRTAPITTRFVQVPAALGAVVKVMNLADIGAWPHAPIKLLPPDGGGGGGEDINGSLIGTRIFRKA